MNQDERRFKSADRVWHADYDGRYLFWSDPTREIEFLGTKTELGSFCASRSVDPPVWVWACEPAGFLIDAEFVLASVYDSQQQAVRPFLSDEQVDALQKLLDNWSMNLDLQSYDVDYERAVVFDKTLMEGQSK